MYDIVLADDETWELIGLKKLIARSQLPLRVVGEAENGIVVLQELEEKRPQILITDIRMPGLSGVQLLQQVQEKGLDVDVIILSGYAEFSYAQAALRYGAKDYLLKPVEPERLQEALGKIIRRWEAKGGEAEGGSWEGRDCQESKGEGRESEEIISVMQQIVMEIQESYQEEITLQGLAKKYHISESRLSVKLKEMQGMSFTKYLTSKRIQKAKELLADERLSVEQVAEMVGYKDYYYFTKVFKKSTGISPSKYRKHL